MTFRQFQKLNKSRCEDVFHPIHDWTPQDWGLAIAGEAGELCNILKKVKRGDYKIDDVKRDLVKELADIITYCDLLMTRLNADTELAIIDKFNEVSGRYNYSVIRK